MAQCGRVGVPQAEAMGYGDHERAEWSVQLRFVTGNTLGPEGMPMALGQGSCPDGEA